MHAERKTKSSTVFPPTFFPSLSISLSLRLKLHSLSFTGDNWLVECQTDAWKRGESVQLKHVDTSMPARFFSSPPHPHSHFPFRLSVSLSLAHTYTRTAHVYLSPSLQMHICTPRSPTCSMIKTVATVPSSVNWRSVPTTIATPQINLPSGRRRRVFISPPRKLRPDIDFFFFFFN